MSRRRSHTRLTNQPATWVTYDDTPTTDGSSALAGEPTPEVPWWYATPMPEPWQSYLWHEWASAWADVTLSVCNGVWSRHGARFYATQRDALLKDDLKDWLIVSAVEAAASFTPMPWHPVPERNWGAWLRARLTMHARQHFTDIIGSTQHPKGEAAVRAYTQGIHSLEFLDEWGNETGYAIGRHALHGESILYSKDPASIIVRIEDFMRQSRDLDRDAPRVALYATTETTRQGQPCLISGCQTGIMARGLCPTHYAAERTRAADNCSEDDCTKPARSKGLCTSHYKRQLEATKADGTYTSTYVLSDACLAEDCDRTDVFARGLCQPHYAQARAQEAPPCSDEGCTSPATRKGLCSHHYHRAWRAAKAQEATP